MRGPRPLFDERPDWRTYSEGYFVEYEGSSEDRASGHLFCGPHEIPGAICFVGQHPLLRFLTLQTSDERLGLGDLGIPALHLLYCWRCELGDLEYTLDAHGGVAVLGEDEWLRDLQSRSVNVRELRAQMTDADSDFPYRDYPDHFPARPATLIAIAADEQRDILTEELAGGRRTFTEQMSRHQVGGFPRLVQPSIEAPRCGECGVRMAFVATIADRCADPRGFTGNSWVQVLFFMCGPCRRVRTFNICD